MSSISARRVRDAGGAQVDDWGPADATPDGFDYAKLLRARATPHRPVSRAAAAPPRSLLPAPQGGEDEAEPESQSQSGGMKQEAAIDDDAPAPAVDHAASRALGSRVAHAAAPIVSTVFARQQRVLDLVNELAREIAGFCSDPAIANGGNWDVQLPLDERLFPHTTLYLTLSRFIMQLRFDAPDPPTKQLLLDHSAMLERELDATLRAWGESRDIQLTVW